MRNVRLTFAKREYEHHLIAIDPNFRRIECALCVLGGTASRPDFKMPSLLSLILCTTFLASAASAGPDVQDDLKPRFLPVAEAELPPDPVPTQVIDLALQGSTPVADLNPRLMPVAKN